MLGIDEVVNIPATAFTQNGSGVPGILEREAVTAATAVTQDVAVLGR